MTLKVDGTNGVLQAYDYQVLTTGFSYTFAAGTQTLVINPAGTLATGTITMPASPVDGMVITVVSTQQVTAVTVAANTGQTMVGGAAQLIPNQPLSFMYRLSNTTWYPFAGGAGRASALASGTTVASTSGTSIDFTSIPSWVKRITVMFNGVSTSGTSNIQIQLGTGSTSYTTSGYANNYSTQGATSISTSSATSGFVCMVPSVATATGSGSMVIANISGNSWVENGQVGETNGTRITSNAGAISLGAALTAVRITAVNGTDTFDAGSINILYE